MIGPRTKPEEQIDDRPRRAAGDVEEHQRPQFVRRDRGDQQHRRDGHDHQPATRHDFEIRTGDPPQGGVLGLDCGRGNSGVVIWGPILSAPATSSTPGAERAGFEPAKECEPLTRLAGECLQPLGHLSGQVGGSLEADTNVAGSRASIAPARHGGVAERSNALVLKTRVRATGPRVRIPPPPLLHRV